MAWAEAQALDTASCAARNWYFMDKCDAAELAITRTTVYGWMRGWRAVNICW